MKRIVLFSLAIAFIFVCPVRAQKVPVVGKLPKVDLGVKIGANFARFGGDNWESTYKPGISAGAIVGVHKNKMGVQAEVLVNSAHYTLSGVKDSVTKGGFRALYLDIPILFEYKLVGKALTPKVWLMAGPQFSTLMSIKSVDASSADVSKTLKSGSFAAVGGVEVRFMKFTVGGRYILGLTDVNNASISSATGAWRSNSFQVYAGFRFL